MSTLSTHILDTALGRPARGIRVALEHEGIILGSLVTDAAGRITGIPHDDAVLPAGIYRLIFHVGEYFLAAGRDTFWTEIVVEFRVGDGAGHYHVPLLLSPYGYSTYRGS